MRERDRHGSDRAPLPEELAAFLREHELAAVWETTDHGTVMVVKAPRREIESARGRVPIQMRNELHQHPSAPVIRTIVTTLGNTATTGAHPVAGRERGRSCVAAPPA